MRACFFRLKDARITGLFLVLLCCATLGIACSCAAAGTSEKVDVPPADTSNIRVAQPGETAEASAIDDGPSSKNSPTTVNVKLTDCSSSPTLPPGFSRDDSSHFSELADDSGNLYEGNTFVQVHLEFTNPHDFDCLLDLGGYRLASFAGKAPGVSQSVTPLWVLNGNRNDRNYFTPAISANASASYVLGYIVPNDIVGSGDVEVILGYDRIGLETKNVRTIDVTSLVGSSR